MNRHLTNPKLAELYTKLKINPVNRALVIKGLVGKSKQFRELLQAHMDGSPCPWKSTTRYPNAPFIFVTSHDEKQVMTFHRGGQLFSYSPRSMNKFLELRNDITKLQIELKGDL